MTPRKRARSEHPVLCNIQQRKQRGKSDNDEADAVLRRWCTIFAQRGESDIANMRAMFASSSRHCPHSKIRTSIPNIFCAPLFQGERMSKIGQGMVFDVRTDLNLMLNKLFTRGAYELEFGPHMSGHRPLTFTPHRMAWFAPSGIANAGSSTFNPHPRQINPVRAIVMPRSLHDYMQALNEAIANIDRSNRPTSKCVAGVWSEEPANCTSCGWQAPETSTVHGLNGWSPEFNSAFVVHVRGRMDTSCASQVKRGVHIPEHVDWFSPSSFSTLIRDCLFHARPSLMALQTRDVNERVAHTQAATMAVAFIGADRVESPDARHVTMLTAPLHEDDKRPIFLYETPNTRFSCPDREVSTVCPRRTLRSHGSILECVDPETTKLTGLGENTARFTLAVDGSEFVLLTRDAVYDNLMSMAPPMYATTGCYMLVFMHVEPARGPRFFMSKAVHCPKELPMCIQDCILPEFSEYGQRLNEEDGGPLIREDFVTPHMAYTYRGTAP